MDESPESFRQGLKSLDSVAVYRLTKDQLGNAQKKEDELIEPTAENPGPKKFAVPIEANLNPQDNGTWQELPQGWLWRLRIDAVEAHSINLGFSRFNLPTGAKLWLYEESGLVGVGPYTVDDRNRKGRFFTPIIKTDKLIIEIFIPGSSSAQPLVDISIKSINRGFRDLGGPDKAGADKQGACNIDVVCPAGNPWSNQIRSVAMYSIDGIDSCTGTLISNTDNDFTPYFLSAFHCGVDGTNDDSLVFYWNYQSTSCGDLSGGDLSDNQSSSTLRARWMESDFLLLELDSNPDPQSNVFFSGWNASGITPSSVVAIHHPSTDEKAISFENNPLTTTDYLSNTTDTSENHWRVSDWNAGTTEQGSSGSCLWDPNDGLCIGQLHGGTAACGNDDPDWYGKLSSSWEGGGNDGNRLRNWLNPANDGTLIHPGAQPVLGTGPILRLVETILDYGDVEIGFAFTKAIVIYNDGDAPLEVSLDYIDPTDTDLLTHWSETNITSGDTIAVGTDPLVLRQVYEPDSPGTHTFQVMLTSNDSSTPSTTITLTGNGEDATPVDSMLVLDRSGSMDETAGDRRKIQAMQSAADLYTHLLRESAGDQLGFVKYNASNSVYLSLDTIDAGHTTTAEDLLSNASINQAARLLPQGGTGIGGAMNTAAAEFGALDPERQRVMVVLTDGIENQSPYIEDVVGPIQASDPDLQVYSIGLGSNIEPLKLQSITNVVNGYHQVSEDLSDVDVFDLEAFYFKIFANATGMQLVVDPTHPVDISNADPILIDSATIVSSDKSAVFLILDDPDMRRFYDILFEDPAGNILVPGSSIGGVPIQELSRLNYRFFRIDFPAITADYTGSWKLLLKPNLKWNPEEVKSILAESPYNYSGYIDPMVGFVPVGFAAAVKSNFKLQVNVLPSNHLPGATIKLQASLSDRGWPSVGGSISVTVTNPSGTTQLVTLYDDGSHGDTESGDGTWTNSFSSTSGMGTYKFYFKANGINERGELAPREATRYASLIAPTDTPGGGSNNPGGGSIQGDVAPYLIGTYDIRADRNTTLFVSNPTGSSLLLRLAFFDDNGAPLRCLENKLAPNDLLELDVRKVDLPSGVGVVKIVSYDPKPARATPTLGIVGHQQTSFADRGVSETSLHPVSFSILQGDLPIIEKVCR